MKSILHKSFKTNKNLEIEGITLEYHDQDEPDIPPVRIRIARAGGANVAYDKALDKRTRSIRRHLAANAVSMQEIRRITMDVYAETVLLGWENVTDEAGDPIPFSPDNARKLFKDLPDLFDDIQQQAQQAELFRSVQIEADAKNL
jgi:hypothetical protein